MNLTKVMDDIAERAAAVARFEEGDYFDDEGLLHCHKCNTPKQCRVNVLGNERVVSCLCRCDVEARKAEAETRERAQFLERCERYRAAGFPESNMRQWTFASDDMSNPQLTKAMQSYVDHFAEFKRQGKGLLLYGSVGTGKTYAACCVANALIDRGYPVLVTNFARLVNTLQGMFEGKQQYIDSLNHFSLLVIDDLGAERNNEYMQEQVWNIIDARYRAQLPMIITSNLSGNELKQPADVSKARVYSRLLERCHPIEVKGLDKRKENLKREHGSMREILGL